MKIILKNGNVSGFTLIEIIVSITIFTYIFGALLAMYIFLSKDIVSGQREIRCSSFTKIMIQNLLTESDFVEIATTSREVRFKKLSKNNYIAIRSDATSSAIYEISSEDLEEFNNNEDERSSYQIGNCGGHGIAFSKSTSTIVSKCLDLQYDIATNNLGTTTKYSEKVCSLF